ncbi:hypothetical protein AV530_007738 [Patagioenas fasciata monilis]|uniref:Uncharacterized protein n=1 Tax=Patagioenas fasciata monilis TaxID=372326 RepID=A0A1V4JZ10_PATFA|nr:hypothetical protein AV530_007738 [Patagioenas fasciata monilis]
MEYITETGNKRFLDNVENTGWSIHHHPVSDPPAQKCFECCLPLTILKTPAHSQSISLLRETYLLSVLLR